MLIMEHRRSGRCAQASLSPSVSGKRAQLSETKESLYFYTYDKMVMFACVHCSAAVKGKGGFLCTHLSLSLSPLKTERCQPSFYPAPTCWQLYFTVTPELQSLRAEGQTRNCIVWILFYLTFSCFLWFFLSYMMSFRWKSNWMKSKLEL